MVLKNRNQAAMTYQRGVFVALALIAILQQANSFVAPQSTVKTGLTPFRQQVPSYQPRQPRLSDEVQATSASMEGSGELSASQKKAEDLKKQIRREGGLFTVRTKYGAVNLYSIYYITMAVLLGIPWYIGLTLYQLFQLITGNRFDPERRIPVFITHCWGSALLHLTRAFPVCENLHILQKFYDQKRCAMFVANHNSYMDIPFLGVSIGWRNYKLIAKKELRKVPLLGKAIEVGGNLMVDRKDKKSGLKTLKRGIKYLQDGVHLCTFPEGTRSRTGRVIPFKNGAFKMAHKAGAPVIPVSIVGANICHPPHWLFPCRPAHNVAKVIIHEPVESVGKTEQELAAEVRRVMIEGLPESQRPLDGE